VAEKTILVCDVCGQPAIETVSIKFGNQSLVKDLCDQHVKALSEGARPARRGRPRKARAAAVAPIKQRRTRQQGSQKKQTSAA